MELVEVRDLDGPNLFVLAPAIKLEVRIELGQRDVDAALDRLAELIGELHQRVGLDAPEVGRSVIDTEHHYALFYLWEWRSCAMEIAETAYNILNGTTSLEDAAPRMKDALALDRQNEDRPEWVRDIERRIPVVGVTGTNGKTTTTRLLAHIARQAGKHVGWSSSSGVYIDGEKVLEGDYTGPSGARRVLLDPDVEIGMLETARGGILLRGVAYESNDVSVFLNLTPDHLYLQGVETLETLAAVKSVVIQVTRPEGLVVLNADDPLVLAQRRRVRANMLLTSQSADNPEIQAHILAGGRAVVRDDDLFVLHCGQERQTITTLANAPMTFNGAARHMVENALAACGAAHGLGFTVDEIAAGLSTFRSDVTSNVGRLNVFRLDDRIIVVDYAHNESGLQELLRFARALMPEPGRLAAIIGTAGDRDDEVLVSLARIAGRDADTVYIKENPRYLRGRELEDASRLMRAGLADAGALDRLSGLYPGEQSALLAALDHSAAGDAIVVMCVEEQIPILRDLRDRGAEEW
ncbi:MAG: hypothetical protein H0V47_06010 [Chloroflexia bacterium]|nr:hypothetical protein [Chloroflexia bacterium]